MALLIQNGSKDFLQARYINFFLDAFSNVLVVYSRKIYNASRIVAMTSNKKWSKKILKKKALIFLAMAPLVEKRSPP